MIHRKYGPSHDICKVVCVTHALRWIREYVSNLTKMYKMLHLGVNLMFNYG